jgi:putative hydrolase of the HAD superfamily
VSEQIKVVLFDVGGVLVQLSGVSTMLEWLGGRVSPAELWKMWLSSPTVRGFETGQIQPEAFASQLIEEMSLPVSESELLKRFATWNLGPFPGAFELVASIPRR